MITKKNKASIVESTLNWKYTSFRFVNKSQWEDIYITQIFIICVFQLCNTKHKFTITMVLKSHDIPPFSMKWYLILPLRNRTKEVFSRIFPPQTEIAMMITTASTLEFHIGLMRWFSGSSTCHQVWWRGSILRTQEVEREHLFLKVVLWPPYMSSPTLTEGRQADRHTHYIQRDWGCTAQQQRAFLARGEKQTRAERWLGSWEYLLLLPRTWNRFPAPTWWLTTICNSSFREAGLQMSSKSTAHKWCTYIYTSKTQNKNK